MADRDRPPQILYRNLYTSRLRAFSGEGTSKGVPNLLSVGEDGVYLGEAEQIEGRKSAFTRARIKKGRSKAIKKQ
jgi:hypothetical protein